MWSPYWPAYTRAWLAFSIPGTLILIDDGSRDAPAATDTTGTRLRAACARDPVPP